MEVRKPEQKFVNTKKQNALQQHLPPQQYVCCSISIERKGFPSILPSKSSIQYQVCCNVLNCPICVRMPNVCSSFSLSSPGHAILLCKAPANGIQYMTISFRAETISASMSMVIISYCYHHTIIIHCYFNQPSTQITITVIPQFLSSQKCQK